MMIKVAVTSFYDLMGICHLLLPVWATCPVFSLGFEVDYGSLEEVDVIEAKCQKRFAETGNLTELKYTS